MRLRQSEETSAPRRETLPAARTEATETLPLAAETVEKVRAPLAVRLLRMMGLLAVALMVLGLLVSVTTGMSPLQWARTADVRKAYGADNLLFIRARALISLGAVAPALDAVSGLPADSQEREELMVDLFPRILAKGDPDLILRAAAQGSGANYRLTLAVPGLASTLGADRIHAMLQAPRYASFRDQANALLVTGEKDLAVAVAHLEWITPGMYRDSAAQYLVQGLLEKQRFPEARDLIARMSTPAAKFNALTTIGPAYAQAGLLEEARRALMAALPLRTERLGPALDIYFQSLAMQYQQKGRTEGALELLERIQDPRQRNAACTTLGSAFTGAEPTAMVERLAGVLRRTNQPMVASEIDSLFQQVALKRLTQSHPERALELVQKMQDPQRRQSAYSALASALQGTEPDATIERILNAIQSAGPPYAANQLEFVVQQLIRRNITEGRKPVARHLWERFGKFLSEPQRRWMERELSR